VGFSTIPEWGAFGFGAIIGWFVYFINRYRKGDVGISDLAAVIGAIGGSTVTGLFGGANLFGAYGIGLAVGFFGYFFVLIILVGMSKNFTSDWFLDGRRPDPQTGVSIPGETRPAMAQGPGGFYGNHPAQAATVAPVIVQPVILAPGPVSPVHLPQPSFAPQESVALNPNAERILNSCKNLWDANKKDCNAFVKAVAADCVIKLEGQADDIVGAIKTGEWRKEADGPAALKAAEEGRLVIGGMTGADLGDGHGHVIVVVAKASDNPKYPIAYWGTLSYDKLSDDQKTWGGDGKHGVNYSFDRTHRDKVYYASIEI